LSADLLEPGQDQSRISVANDIMLVNTRVAQSDPTHIGLDVRWAGGDPARQFYIGLNLNGFGVPDSQWFPGAWWAVPLADQTVHIDVNLDSRTLSATGRTGPLPVASRLFDSRDGDYSAALSLWEPDLVRRGWFTPFINVFDMQTRHGQVTSVVPARTQLTVVTLVPPTTDAPAAAFAHPY
jgi:hypothetical protein